MRAFWEVVKLEVKQDIQYPFGFMISVIIQPIILLLNIALFTSLYGYNGSDIIKGYEMGQMIWYFTATHFIWVFVYNQTDYRISQRVLSGELAVDLLRPMNIFVYELGNSVGLRLTALVTELVPGIILYSLIYFPYFMTPMSILRFCCTIVMAFILMYTINFLAGLFAFILKSNAAVSGLKFLAMGLLGGSNIPLDFYPASVQRVLAFLPFEYIFYWPIQFFLNTEQSVQQGVFVRTLVVQGVWCVVLIALCSLAWRRASRHFCAVG